jgi:hypothetical protein
MKFRNLFACGLLLAATSAATAGPVTQIAKLSPRYNSNVLEIEWASALVGGCNTSTVAITNGAVSNANQLAAFLLAAYTAQLNVEVLSGRRCGHRKRGRLMAPASVRKIDRFDSTTSRTAKRFLNPPSVSRSQKP